MFSRGTISQPLATMFNDESYASRSFCEKYEEVRNVLKQVFRACNSRLVQEFVVLLGPSPSSPKEIYRVPLKLCEVHHGNLDEGCGENCGELTSKEKREVFSSFLKMTSLASLMPLNNTAKVFLYIRVTEKLLNNVENLELDESFELPNEETCTKRKISSETLWIQHCCSLEEENEKNQSTVISDNTSLWLRVSFFLNKVS